MLIKPGLTRVSCAITRSTRNTARADTKQNSLLDMETSLNLLDTVVATVNFPDHNVLAGDLGAIVEVYTHPSLAYDVEFVNPDGSTRALLTLVPEQVRVLSPADVLTTRQLALAA
jgi:hypothetical protein